MNVTVWARRAVAPVLKLAFISTTLLCLLVGCAESKSPPVFSDVPGLPPEAPAQRAQAALPGPNTPLPPADPPAAWPAPAASPVPAAPPVQAASPVPSTPQAAESQAALYVFTFGAFKHPGRYAWTNGMTLQDGIQAAGGLDESARRKLLLYHEEGLAERILLARDKSLTTNPALRPGDKIVSPQD